MNQIYNAYGKLMISGEYLVLKGAQALVLPLNIGQEMKVEAIPGAPDPVIEWRASVCKSLWFSAVIGIRNWTINKCSDSSIANKLVQHFKTVEMLNKAHFTSSWSYKISTETGFDLNWGFGSSAALIANLAKWAGVDPFDLYFRVAQGSGADLAASMSSGPVLYKLQDGKPVIRPVNFKPRFHRNIWFIYLGNKQNSETSVNIFRTSSRVNESHVAASNRLTEEMLQAGTVTGLEHAVREHEILMSEILDKVRIKEERFADFNGEIKSLGAWGGDFIMAVSEEGEESVRSYFKSKGMDVVFSFEKIIL